MIYSIPFSLPFLGTVSEYLLNQNSHFPLSEWTIYLPTRRACSVLENALFEKSDKKSLILPRLVPLGEVNPEELSLLSPEGAAEVALLPPVISAARRRILLASLIEKFQYADHFMPFDQALRWSDNLMNLLDEMRTHGIDLKALKEGIPFTGPGEHWERVQKFLNLISDYWDRILEEEKCIEGVTWQKRLMEVQADILENKKPSLPIMVAGSLGTIPSTLRLIEVISRLPHGVIILPGFQRGLKKEALSPRHAQFFLYRLLSKLEISEEEVRDWNVEEERSGSLFLEKIFDPLSLTQQNRSFLSISNIEYIEASNQGEEARLIGVAIRQALEEGKKKILCISGDQNLLSRISAELEFWNLSILPQQTQSLLETPLGTFLHLAALWVSAPFPATVIAAIFKHPFSADKKEIWSLFERHVLRTWTGTISIPTLEYLMNRTQQNLEPALWDQLKVFYDSLKDHLGFSEGSHSLGYYLSKIESLFAWVVGKEQKIEELLIEFSSAEGIFFQELWADLKKSFDLEIKNPHNFSEIFLTLFKGHRMPLTGRGNENIFLINPSEARFMEGDFKILAGLNEGIWPTEPSVDPFFSASMRKALNLPSVEMRLGQSAHDFLSYLCGPGKILITRSLQIGGVPSVSSRFLSHLELAAKAHGLRIPLNLYLKPWTKILYHETERVACSPPKPLPPLEHRPTRFSVTDIPLLLEDPYSIYAKYILNLKRLEPFEGAEKPRLFGIFVHDILHRWPLTSGTILDEEFEGRAKLLFELYLGSIEKSRFWWEKFLILAHWVKQQKSLENTLTEIKGEVTFAVEDKLFTLVGKADRIDWDKEGAIIIDYKTGSVPSLLDIKSGKAPQLPLEALIFLKKGFSNIPILSLNALQYWGVLSEELVSIEEDLPLLVSQTQKKLEQLMGSFYKPTTPYLAHPRGFRTQGFYDHLSRVQEWYVVR